MRVFESEVRRYIPSGWRDFSMDTKVFAYLILISIFTGVLFGLAPALRLAKLNVNSVLKDGSRGATGGGRGKYLSGLLVIAEMGLAVVLLTGAGLMIRSFVKVYRAPLGVETSHVLTMRLFLPDAKYPHDQDQIAFHERLKPRLEAIAGVDSVAVATTLPTGGSMDFPYELEGAPPADPKRRPSLNAVIIGPDYFRVMTAPCLAGRVFNSTDGVSGPPVGIVNQKFATKSWPGEDPLGKRLRTFESNAAGAWLTVVGVVPNIVQNEISPREIDPLIYLPFRQKPARGVAIVAKTHVPPGSVAQAFRREVQGVDSDMPVFNLWTMDQRLERNYWFLRIIGMLFAIFAAIALLLASVGLYAVIAHSVNQRTQEIGIRMALGASTRDVSKLVFAQGMAQVAIGLAIGLAGAVGLTRLLKSILFQVSPNDPGTFLAVAVILALAALLGCALPARRAMRVDPLIALRHE
jgi:predicted permease